MSAVISASTVTEDRALSLLGSGIPAENVAAALGVTPGRISQLLADKRFADQVASLRYDNLQKHNTRDATYDSLEDRLIQKLEKQIPLIMRPMDTVRAIQAINGAKRRGQSAPEQVTNQQNIVALVLPAIIAQRFTTNITNQVVKAGKQELITMQAGNLLEAAEAREKARVTLEGIEGIEGTEGSLEDSNELIQTL